jgi:hypothetical protein
MKPNIGTTDKALRISAGLILIVTAFMIPFGAALTILFSVAGIISLLTSIFGFCLLYRLIGVNTYKMESNC